MTSYGDPVRVAMIVGNGLALDFKRHAGALLVDWNPSRPLSWNVQSLDRPSVPLIERLPKLKAELASISAREPGLSDFEALARIYGRLSPHAPLDKIVVEARHYLLNAYVAFQYAANQANFNEWSWTKWLAIHAPSMVCAASFNYDTVFETALGNIGRQFHHLIGRGAHRGVPVFKPHGSIDFAFLGIAAAEGPDGPALPAEYPLQIYVDFADVPREEMSRISLDEARSPRLVSTIVLPSEASGYRNLQWVNAGYAVWKTLAPVVTHVIIVGLSYWECDRPEINELVLAMPTSARAFLADPSPNACRHRHS